MNEKKRILNDRDIYKEDIENYLELERFLYWEEGSSRFYELDGLRDKWVCSFNVFDVIDLIGDAVDYRMVNVAYHRINDLEKKYQGSIDLLNNYASHETLFTEEERKGIVEFLSQELFKSQLPAIFRELAKYKDMYYQVMLRKEQRRAGIRNEWFHAVQTLIYLVDHILDNINNISSVKHNWLSFLWTKIERNLNKLKEEGAFSYSDSIYISLGNLIFQAFEECDEITTYNTNSIDLEIKIAVGSAIISEKIGGKLYANLITYFDHFKIFFQENLASIKMNKDFLREIVIYTHKLEFYKLPLLEKNHQNDKPVDFLLYAEIFADLEIFISQIIDQTFFGLNEYKEEVYTPCYVEERPFVSLDQLLVECAITNTV